MRPANSSFLSVVSRCPCWTGPCRARALPNGRALWHRHPIGRSRPRLPAGPGPGQGSAAPGADEGVAPAGGSGHDHPYLDERRHPSTRPGMSPGPEAAGAGTRISGERSPAPSRTSQGLPVLVKASPARIATGMNLAGRPRHLDKGVNMPPGAPSGGLLTCPLGRFAFPPEMACGHP